MRQDYKDKEQYNTVKKTPLPVTELMDGAAYCLAYVDQTARSISLDDDERNRLFIALNDALTWARKHDEDYDEKCRKERMERKRAAEEEAQRKVMEARRNPGRYGTLSQAFVAGMTEEERNLILTL